MLLPYEGVKIEEERLKRVHIRLNHYFLQSLDFFNTVKAVRGDATSAAADGVRNSAYFERMNMNQTFDDTLLQKRRREDCVEISYTASEKDSMQ